MLVTLRLVEQERLLLLQIEQLPLDLQETEPIHLVEHLQAGRHLAERHLQIELLHEFLQTQLQEALLQDQELLQVEVAHHLEVHHQVEVQEVQEVQVQVALEEVPQEEEDNSSINLPH